MIPEGPVVKTHAGAVRGLWRGEPGAAVASAAFLGIPFARPPVGELRFAAPVPPETWEGVRDATAHGATAQRGDPGVTLIPEPSIPGEATLNVDVCTPAPGEGSGLPVLVWIHGGGYTAGSPASPWYDGRAFNRDGVVTVTLSYRLGFDGFGHIPGAPSNRGVRDWLLALEWVQENIAVFGGDPRRVTIAGQSAGGGAVLTLLGMPAAQHLFSAAWSLSGALADVSPERARTAAARLANLAGVAPDRAGFGSVPEERLLALQEGASSSESRDRLAPVRSLVGDGLPWGPMVDGDLIARPALQSIRDGVGANKPLVLGATDDEFTMATDTVKGRLRIVPTGLALSKLLPDTEVRRAYLSANRPQHRKGTAAVIGRFVTDAIFRSTVVRVAEARADVFRSWSATSTRVAPSVRDPRETEHPPAATWVYAFSWVSPTRGWALHCLDVPFWFDCLSDDAVAAITGDAPPQALADAVHGAAAAFVREGDPGWAPWSSSPGTTRVFGGEASAPDVVRDGYASVRALA